jgi:hypothetical protein
MLMVTSQLGTLAGLTLYLCILVCANYSFICYKYCPEHSISFPGRGVTSKRESKHTLSCNLITAHLPTSLSYTFS